MIFVVPKRYLHKNPINDWNKELGAFLVIIYRN